MENKYILNKVEDAKSFFFKDCIYLREYKPALVGEGAGSGAEGLVQRAREKQTPS